MTGGRDKDSWTGTTEEKVGTESSVSLASIQGVEHHHPTMHIPSGHGGRPRIREEGRILFYQLDTYSDPETLST